MRRALLLAIAIVLGAAAPAPAGELLTWETTSRHVNPASEPFNGPPPGVPARPNALRVNVLLPDAYDPRRRYPVLYLLHGHGDSFDHWASAQRGDVRRIAAGFPGIIVMPEGARGWYANWWREGRRANPAWERYHLDELVPLVERRLPIRAGRRWHAIAGLSMGGEGAMFYASQRPGYFGSAAAFSGAISIQRPEWPAGFDTQGERHVDVFGDPEEQRFYWTGHNPTALTDNLRHTRLYVAVGDGTPKPEEATNAFGVIAEVDLRQHAQDFVASARASGAPTTYEPHAGIHDWPYWRADLAAALRWGFFAPVPERPRKWTLQTVAMKGDAWGWRFEFQRRPPDEILTLSREGQTLRGEGRGRLAIKPPRGRLLVVRLPFSRRIPPGL
jgi:S-formylglutathione hydrolase FrmB